MTLQEFISEHRNDDVRQLALQSARFPGIDMRHVLEQIAGWQKAFRKLPTLAATDGIIYPPHLSMEQCSGEHAATYKAEVARRLLLQTPGGDVSADGDEKKGALMVDLTGGFGIDFMFMARRFARAVYVERDSRLCDVARHNFGVIGLDSAETVCSDGSEYLHALPPADLIYIDPARRDAAGGRTYAISDCTPDVLGMLQEMLERAAWVMIKLSPMLDWHDAVASMNAVAPRSVRDVHIVSTRGECKEMLFVLAKDCCDAPVIHCADGTEELVCTAAECAEPEQMIGIPYSGLAGKYVYEPGASVMKAGCFGLLCRRYGVKAVGRNSRLFVSDDEKKDFPGRRFRINAVSSMNKKELKGMLGDIRKANIAVRNFPLTVAGLRRKLKLGEGGDVYIFATTAADGTRMLAVCTKA